MGSSAMLGKCPICKGMGFILLYGGRATGCRACAGSGYCGGWPLGDDEWAALKDKETEVENGL